MRIAICFAVLLSTTTAFSAESGADGPIRVACVGDSITYGSGVENREQNAYPAVLGRLLGERYEVRNFGVGGATLQKRGDKPYWSLDAYKDVTLFKPHIVVIKLGTNDSKPQTGMVRSCMPSISRRSSSTSANRPRSRRSSCVLRRPFTRMPSAFAKMSSVTRLCPP